MPKTIPDDAVQNRLSMLKNFELDLLVAMDDIVVELEALQARAMKVRADLRTVRAAIRALETNRAAAA
jgi:hypothetical protein